MKLDEIIKNAELETITAIDRLDIEVTGGYAGDLLSAVMANAKEGNVWVTWHVHPNIVAVALVVKLAAIILVNDRRPEEETIQKAEQEGLPILVSKLSEFELSGKLYSMGISGAQ